MTKVSTNWKTLSRKPLVKNKFTELWEEEVVSPNGSNMTWFVKRNGDFSIIIPIDSEHTYLVNQFRYPVKSLSPEFPMGRNENDSPLDAAKRELKEETGIEAGSLTKIANWWLGPGSSDIMITLFVAKDLSFGNSAPDENEFLEVKKVTIAKVGEMIANGEILDGPTIAAYHYLELYLQKL